MRSRSKWQGGRRSRPREVILHEMITEVGGGGRSCHHGGCKGDLNRSMLLPRGEKEKVVAQSIALWWWAFRISQEHTPHQWKLYRVREMGMPIRLHRFTRPSLLMYLLALGTFVPIPLLLRHQLAKKSSLSLSDLFSLSYHHYNISASRIWAFRSRSIAFKTCIWHQRDKSFLPRVY